MSAGLMLSACAPKTENSSGAATETGSSESKKPLVVAMELAYPPFETRDEEGNPVGISIDIAKGFGEFIGREVVIENTAWDGLIPALQTDRADMVISSMTISEERKQTVDFSEPYANAMLALLTNKNSKIEKAEDLNVAGKKIAVKTGTTGHAYAMKSFTNAQLIVLDNESACVAEVSQGKADAFIYDQLTIYRNWKNNESTTNAVFIPFQDVEYWGVAVKKGNTELLDSLNTYIKKSIEDGTFDKISDKYLSEEKKSFEEMNFKWFFDLKKD